MSFIKSLIFAILATVFLTYVLGVSLLEIIGGDVVYIQEQLIAPFKVISISALFSVLLIALALVIVLSVFGSIIFIFLLGIGAAIMFMVGVFWPILLVGLFIWLLVKNNSITNQVPR